MSSSTRILIGLVAGIALGRLLGPSPAVDGALAAGNIWLDALRMTVIPLVVSLVISSISSAANAASARGLTGRAVALFIAFLFGGALFTVATVPALLSIWTPPGGAAEAFHTAQGQIPTVPKLTDWISGLIPPNVFKAASDGAMLQLLLFALIFAFAATRVDAQLRDPVIKFFQGIAEIMMVIVDWVLWTAPVGVFCLALTVGAQTGFAAAGVLAHYIVIVSLACLAMALWMYPVVRIFASESLLRFTRAVAPAQVVAISTQSSLASLPAMLQASQESLGIPTGTAGLVLPLAVSLFRITSPAGNLAVAIYIGTVSGVHLGVPQLLLGAVVATIVSLGMVGIASQATFFAGTAPVCAAMGVPVEPLAILIAVETIPDIFRTIGNVTADVAVTDILHRRS